jgi:aminopeptidase N
MLKLLLGDDGFRAGMDLYFSRHDGQAATVDQFVQCFADAAGRELRQFMLWYSQAGTPQITVNTQYDPARSTCRLEITQSVPPTPGQPTKDPMQMPFSFGLVGPDGRDLPLVLGDGARLERGVLALSRPTETFTFTGITRRPVPSLNRDFAAPINLTANLSPDDLRFLAAHDPDPFNRWQAVQTLATRLLVDSVAALRAGTSAREDEGLTRALGAILSNDRLEPAFIAQALTLPSEADISREIGRDVDPDAVFKARDRLRRTVGAALGASLRATYGRLSTREAYRPDAASAGRRALRNVCLDLMATTREDDTLTLAVRQLETADNMTDRMAALATLALYDTPHRTAALDQFYRRYEADPLVIDKWFAMQASIPEPATLDQVRKLIAHPAFSLGNPNRVRALIGSFAQANQTQFNRPDGGGFTLVADTVLELDTRNPQVAARLLTAFRSWRALEPGRRGLAHAALNRIAAVDNLSRDLRDIVERSRADS